MADRRKQSYFPVTNEAFSDTGVAGGAFLALSPENNPAYQAAIKKGRPARSGFTTITTPSGGTMSVPVGQERKYTDLLYKNNPVADTGFQRPNPQEAYALGNTGAVPTGNTPYAQSYRMGYEGGGVQQPPTTFGYQAGQALSGIPNALSGFAKNVASLFNNPQAQQYGQGVSTGQPPNQALAAVQNFQQRGQFNRPIQPRRYFDPNSNYGL